MYRKLSEKIVDFYQCDWQNDMRMREACICGVETVCSTAGNILILLLLSCLLSKGVEIVLFFLVYGIGRLYAGGIHARNHLECMVMYTICLLGSIYLAEYLAKINFNIFVAWIFVPAITIFLNVRYGGKQKKISEADRAGYQKKCRIIILLFNSINFSLGILVKIFDANVWLKKAFWIMAFALLTQSVLLLIEQKRGKLVQEKSRE